MRDMLPLTLYISILLPLRNRSKVCVIVNINYPRMTSSVDVLIIGGGPAGLACAGGLARQLHTAIVFSHGKFRDERAQVLQNVAGWGQEAPADFREKTRNDILVRHGDTVQFRDVEIRGVKRLVDGRFEALDAHGGKYHGRRVLLTSGVKDQMLSIPGYEELWGRGMCVYPKYQPTTARENDYDDLT